MTDERLAAAAQAGDTQAADQLVRRHQRLVSGVATEFFVPGYDRDDVVQEANLGLLQAIRAYEPGHGCSFVTFARLACRRQCIDAVLVAGRQKHRPLTDSVRELVLDDGTRRPVVELIPSGDATPHQHVENRETIRVLRGALGTLTETEYHAVVGVAIGVTHADLWLPGFTPKTIDNALQRGRAKLRRALDADLEAAA